LQADHWKIYPCEVTPFSKIEKWYEEGKFTPYTDKDPNLLLELLVRVKAAVPPWIRLNRVIRDIPTESIIGGNANTNLRQAIFTELAKRNQCCRCIRCREVRDWPEEVQDLRIRVRPYRSSHGDELFVSAEGKARGAGGGATQRNLGTKQAPKKAKHGLSAAAITAWRASIDAREAEARANADENALLALESERDRLDEKALAEIQPAAEPSACDDPDNAALYGLLRLRFNDDVGAAAAVFPELEGCALIRELHVYGQLVASRRGENSDERPQHRGVGTRLMCAAEGIAWERGYRKIAVISGVGVRNYYRRLGYELCGDGQYLVKKLSERPGVHRAAIDGEPFVLPEEPKSLLAGVSMPLALSVLAGVVAIGAAALLRRK
jgi:histone acetyltransferase (RNA polymerase elongator complex component)